LLRCPDWVGGVVYDRGVVRSVAAMIVAAVLVAACGGSEAATTPVGSDADDAAVTEVPMPESPLEAELGFASEPERRRFQLISRQQAADTTMVQCMQQAGFFYAVRPAEETFRSGAFVGDGSREWTLVNGLGITSSFIDALATDAARTSPDAASSNLDYVASLTPAQQVDYDLALIGDLVASSEPTTAVQGSGCWEQSYPDVVSLLALINEFEPELASLNSRLNADPRVQEFQSTWSTCMDAAGYSYTSERALSDDVYARLLDIELVDNRGVTQVVSPEALDELSIYERQVAVASYDCRQSFAAELEQLRSDYEREFLDDNRFRIADLQD